MEVAEVILSSRLKDWQQRMKKMKPWVFIGSSKEQKFVAEALQASLLDDTDAQTWWQGVFELSKTNIENLFKALDVDFAVFVFAPDDVARVRGATHRVARDNVLYEFGLFAGRIGRERTYIVAPAGLKLDLPSDLLGIGLAYYDRDHRGGIHAGIGSASTQILTQIRSLGLRRRAPMARVGPPPGTLGDELRDAKKVWLALMPFEYSTL